MLDGEERADSTVGARLVAEAAVPVRDPARRWSGGGWVVPGAGADVFALKRDLRVAARFPVPLGRKRR